MKNSPLTSLSLVTLTTLLAATVACGNFDNSDFGDDDFDDDDDDECGVLHPGQQLDINDEVTSCNGAYRFIMQGDGNVVLYVGDFPLFSSHTDGLDTGPLRFQSDGDMVLRDTDGNVIFSTNTAGNPDALFVMQDDGNAVIYADESDTTEFNAIWVSGTAS